MITRRTLIKNSSISTILLLVSPNKIIENKIIVENRILSTYNVDALTKDNKEVTLKYCYIYGEKLKIPPNKIVNIYNCDMSLYGIIIEPYSEGNICNCSINLNNKTLDVYGTLNINTKGFLNW